MKSKNLQTATFVSVDFSICDGLHFAHVSHAHLFVQVLATPTSSDVPVDNVLMPHWRAIEYLIAVMEVMRLAAHVS